MEYMPLLAASKLSDFLAFSPCWTTDLPLAKIKHEVRAVEDSRHAGKANPSYVCDVFVNFLYERTPS